MTDACKKIEEARIDLEDKFAGVSLSLLFSLVLASFSNFVLTEPLLDKQQLLSLFQSLLLGKVLVVHKIWCKPRLGTMHVCKVPSQGMAKMLGRPFLGRGAIAKRQSPTCTLASTIAVIIDCNWQQHEAIMQ